VFPLSAGDVVVGCVTENNSKYLGQTLRLVQSIRWFGGELAKSRLVVAAVGEIDPRARRALERFDAEIRIVRPFHAGNPSSNRLRIFDELRDARERHFLILDTDTIVVADPLPLLRRDVLQAKIAPFATVTHEVFERLFAHFALPLPPRSFVTGYSGTPTIPYINAGVLSMPAAIAARLAPEWQRFNAVLADDPALVAPCERHMHQAALALALATTGVPFEAIGAALNYQLNATHVPAPQGYAEIDPIIIHYHHLADDDGLLLPCPFPRAQKRIDAFNERLRDERARATGVRQEGVAATTPTRIVVAGMHRSGTSLVARLLRAMGCYAGEEQELPPPDVFNPTGYWEHRDVWALDEAILAALDASWLEPGRAELSRLSVYDRRRFASRARTIARTLDAHGTWMVKDPRLSIVFPIWREALGDPICVFVWREPFAVARSLAQRDGLPLVAGIALWEEYTRAALASTIGLPRVGVAYEELVANPIDCAARLHRELAAAGADGLRLPSADELHAIVDPALNRSGSADDRLLNRAQIELRDALRSGAALLWDDVAPIDPEPRALLTAYVDATREIAALRKRVGEHGALLDATFASRSWRIGFGVTRLWRRVVRSQQPTAVDRWTKSWS